MVYFNGKFWSKIELLRRIGDISQVGGARLLQYDEGPERGVRIVRVNLGAFKFDVVVDRGLDISRAEYKGIPLSWQSPAREVNPAFYDSKGIGWIWGFYGGLMTTCGLTQVGSPTVDEGEELGLHGRFSYIPTRNLCINEEWIRDDYTIQVKGKIREARLFGPNLVLERTIEAKIGEKSFTISDRIRNEGWRKTPLMILYHFNIGWPIIDEGSKLVSTSIAYYPRDEEAWKDYENFDTFTVPTKNYKEKVYFHVVKREEKGFAYAGIVNKKLGLGIAIKFKGLNRLIEWKMMGEGEYVVGVEPSNCFVLGRKKEKELGTLEYLNPGEERKYQLEFNVLEDDEIDEFVHKVFKVMNFKRSQLIRELDELVQIVKST